MRRKALIPKTAGIAYMVFLACFFPISMSASEEELGLSEVIAGLQERYEKLGSFSCDFTQVQWNKALNRKQEESGRAYMKKPGMMRWEYVDPEPKLFIARNDVFVFYLPEENQVQRYHSKNTSNLATPTLFLAGRGNLEREFVISFAHNGLPENWENYYVLELLPKAAQENFESLVMAVDKKSFLVKRLTLVDLLENRSEFAFSNIEENCRIEDEAFDFEIPANADVLIVN